ncbi:MAG: hypothetical protein ABWZ82_06125 [Candidatus Limnocylindrales bacterium]
MTGPDARPLIHRPDPATAWPTWLALLVAAALLTWTGTPPTMVAASLLVVVATLLVSLRVAVAPVAMLVLMGVGLALRAAAVGGGWSDVMLVTDAAIRTMLEGTSPYGIGYEESIPPGAPFAYGPIALLWYLPGQGNPGRMETLLTMLVVVVLAIRGRPLGLALYATLPPLLVTATDGSNDTSAGVLILVALLVAQRSPVAGGALLAVAAAFKPYAVAWLLPLLAYGGIAWPLTAFLIGSIVAWGWAVLAWGPRPILDSLAQAEGVHAVPYYSLAWVAQDLWRMPEAAWSALRYALGLLVAAIGWLEVRTARSFVVTGCAIFVVTLYAGWWSTFAYLAALAPVVCWHLDDWLGLGELRVRWPADPVGRITARVDARWPIKRPWSSSGPVPGTAPLPADR